ncbi:MAG: peptide deformylase [Acutalibacteraceae bacterium]
MVKSIVTDIIFLGQKSEPATQDDISTADDLLDTLRANSDRCVGMAANMIGVKKCIIVFEADGTYCEMFNPKIIKQSKPYETVEGCLSLTGTRMVRRFQSIKVQWQNRKFQTRIKNFEGWTAQIIQHEIDHCNGIII